MSEFLEFRECAGCSEQFPIRSKYAHRAKWCSERCRKRQYASPCIECGAPANMNGSGGLIPTRCARCGSAASVEATKARSELAELIVRLWGEGLTLRELASELGITRESLAVLIARLRARGYDLPYRRPPETVARIKAAAIARCREKAAA